MECSRVYKRVNFCIMPPEPDGRIHFVSIVPPCDGRKAHLEFFSLQTIMPIKPSPLLSLPLEVLYNILNQIEDRADLERLLRACPRLYNILIPLMWRSVTINLRNSKKLESIPTHVPALRKARSETLDRLQFVKRIVVKGTSPPQPFCIHRNREYGAFFRNTSEEIASFVSQLKKNSLKQFIWATGTCISGSVISRWGGCLAKTQPDLEELKLVLNPGCIASQMILHLSEFKKLKYLSLRGLRKGYGDYHYDDMHDGLLASSSTLVELELGVAPEQDRIPYTGSWDGTRVFPFEKCPSDRLLFPKLRVLHLEMISLLQCAAKLARGIDLVSMTSLTFRHCEGWDKFCRRMARAEQPLSLKQLELQWHTGSDNSQDDIIILLSHSPRIETVSLCDGYDSSSLEALETWQEICHGRTSLRDFVYHEMDFRSKKDYLSPLEDPKNGSSDDIQRLFDISKAIALPRANPFTNSNLEFLGICCFPTESLRGILWPLAKQNRLRVIHFRKSACNMTSLASFTKALDLFVQWAFGHQGIPSLQLILFGDYSTFTVRKGANCRYDRKAKYPFYAAKVDPDISDLSPRVLSMVKACPVQYIMK